MQDAEREERDDGRMCIFCLWLLRGRGAKRRRRRRRNKVCVTRVNHRDQVLLPLFSPCPCPLFFLFRTIFLYISECCCCTLWLCGAVRCDTGAALGRGSIDRPLGLRRGISTVLHTVTFGAHETRHGQSAAVHSLTHSLIYISRVQSPHEYSTCGCCIASSHWAE